LTQDVLYSDRPTPGKGYVLILVFAGAVFVVLGAVGLSSAIRENEVGRAIAFLPVTAGLLAGDALIYWYSRSVRYEITSESLTLKIGMLKAVIPIQNVKRVDRQRAFHFGTGSFGNRLTGGVTIDAGPFKSYWITPSDTSVFVSRLEEARRSRP
jgi:hypothetical protein